MLGQTETKGPGGWQFLVKIDVTRDFTSLFIDQRNGIWVSRGNARVLLFSTSPSQISGIYSIKIRHT